MTDTQKQQTLLAIFNAVTTLDIPTGDFADVTITLPEDFSEEYYSQLETLLSELFGYIEIERNGNAVTFEAVTERVKLVQAEWQKQSDAAFTNSILRFHASPNNPYPPI